MKIVFSEPLAYAPGERFQYTDAAYYLLSRMVERVAGEKLSDLVRRELAVKMRFREFACKYGVEVQELCKTRKGRSVPLIEFGQGEKTVFRKFPEVPNGVEEF